MRETPALTVCHMLCMDGAFVHVYDPKVERATALEEFAHHDMEVDESRFILCDTPEEAVQDAHAIVVLTEWDCFKVFDYSAFYAAMQKPAFLFDGRNMLDHYALQQIGFEVHALGKTTGASVRPMAEARGSISLAELVPQPVP